MPKLTVQKNTGLKPAEAFSKVKNMLENDPGLKKLDASYQCTFNEADLTGSAIGKLFKANMTVKDASGGSEVVIIVDLPLAMALFKGTVQETLSRKLEKSLA